MSKLMRHSTVSQSSFDFVNGPVCVFGGNVAFMRYLSICIRLRLMILWSTPIDCWKCLFTEIKCDAIKIRTVNYWTAFNYCHKIITNRSFVGVNSLCEWFWVVGIFALRSKCAWFAHWTFLLPRASANLSIFRIIEKIWHKIT